MVFMLLVFIRYHILLMLVLSMNNLQTIPKIFNRFFLRVRFECCFRSCMFMYHIYLLAFEAFFITAFYWLLLPAFSFLLASLVFFSEILQIRPGLPILKVISCIGFRGVWGLLTFSSCDVCVCIRRSLRCLVKQWNMLVVYSAMLFFGRSSSWNMPSRRVLWTCHGVVGEWAAKVEVEAAEVVAGVDPRTKCHSSMHTLYELHREIYWELLHYWGDISSFALYLIPKALCIGRVPIIRWLLFW